MVRFLKRSGVDTRSCPDLTSALLRSLVDEDLGVAVDAKDVLHGQVVRDHSFATDVVFIGESSPLQELAQNKKETLRLRLYDFVVAVAKVYHSNIVSRLFFRHLKQNQRPENSVNSVKTKLQILLLILAFFI